MNTTKTNTKKARTTTPRLKNGLVAPDYPAEFLRELVLLPTQAIDDWMKANAPREIYELYDDALMIGLNIDSVEKEGGLISMDCESMNQSAGRIMRNMVAIGYSVQLEAWGDRKCVEGNFSAKGKGKK
jgi:hypothetical protein